MFKITKLTDEKTVMAKDLRKGMKIEYANKILEVVSVLSRSSGPIITTIDNNGNFMKLYSTNNMSMKVVGSAKDAVNTEVTADVDLDFLIKDEIEAIDGYRKMIAKTSNPKLLSVLSHILDEETEHIEELRAAQVGVYEVNVDDSIHDRLGEGKCAPTGTVSLVSFAEDAAELLKNIQKNVSDPLYKNKLAFAKHKYDQVKNMIERERQEVDAFDRYWQSHKDEMTANILAAKKALR